MIPIQAEHLRWLRLCGATLVVSGLVFGAAAALWGATNSGFTADIVTRLIITPVICVTLGSLLVVSAATLQRRRCMQMTLLTLAFGAIAAVYWLLWIWSAHPRDADLIHLKMLGTLSAVVIGLAIASQLLAVEVESLFVRLLCNGLAIWTGCYAAWCVLFIWSPWLQHRDGLFGPATVLAGVMTLGLLLTARLIVTRKKRAGARESLASRPRLRMTCPKCGVEQTHQTGPARCPRCRLVMMIDVQEPRCECGYLLYQLTGDTCPECGRAVLVLHEAMARSVVDARTPEKAST